MKTIIGFITVFLLAGCSAKQPITKLAELPTPVSVTKDVCGREPEICSESCADCENREGCIANNGECNAGGLHLNDTGDVGADIWTPGCHYEYTDPACTQNKKFFRGDECSEKNRKELIEWTVSTCHAAMGDREVFDCDKECRRADLGAGTCVVVKNVCAGNDSAVCKCEKPLPTN